MSQSDRSSDGLAIRLGIANASQTIAVSATEAEAEAERSYARETSHHGVAYVSARASSAPSPVETPDEMMALRAESIAHLDFDARWACEAVAPFAHPEPTPGTILWDQHGHRLAVLCDRHSEEQRAVADAHMRCCVCGHQAREGDLVREIGPIR